MREPAIPNYDGNFNASKFYNVLPSMVYRLTTDKLGKSVKISITIPVMWYDEFEMRGD